MAHRMTHAATALHIVGGMLLLIATNNLFDRPNILPMLYGGLGLSLVILGVRSTSENPNHT